MPAIDTVRNTSVRPPRRTPKPKPKRRYVAVPSGDQLDRQKAARAQQLARSTPKTPDQADRQRSPATRRHDAEVVKRTVRESRVKAQAKKNAGGGARLVKDIVNKVTSTVYGPGGPNRNNVVSPKEAARLRAKGVKVRTLSKEESRDVGATIGVKTIGTTGAVRAATATAQGIAQDPKTAVPATLKGLRDMVTGAPAALVKTVTDPKGTAKEMGADYKRRYGGLNSPGGQKRMADRVAKEGAAPELADLTSIGVPIGKAADIVLGAGARRGVLGAAAKRAVESPRKKVRVSGGKGPDAVREQKKSKGLVGAALAQRKDRKAGEAVAREVTSTDRAARKRRVEDADSTLAAVRSFGDDGAPDLHLGDVDGVVREAFNRGELVPTRRISPTGRRVVSQRQLEKAQRGAYAAEKGRALHRQRTEQRAEIAHGANKNLAGLNHKERRAFKTAMQTGAMTPDAGKLAVERRIAMIERARRYGDDTRNTDVDELPTLRRILDNPRAHFTPRLERAVRKEMERGARVGEGDPALGRTATERAETAESRRLAPQADTLGVNRRGMPIKEAERVAGEKVKNADARLSKAKAAHERAEKRAAAVTGYAKSGVDRTKRAMGSRRRTKADGTVVHGTGPIGRAERAAEIHENVARNWERKASRARTPEKKADYQARAAAAFDRGSKARRRLEKLEGGKDAARPEYRRAVAKARRRADEAAHEVERQLEGLKVAKDAQGSVKRQKAAGAELIGAEPAKDFQRRVREARPDGFGEPGFFPSVRRHKTRFAPFTVGGARRAKADARYKGKLFRSGREDNSLAAYTQALAKNIKRMHNWKLVSDTIEAHAFEWGKGLKYGEAMDELARRGVDSDSVRIVDMDAFDARARKASDSDAVIRDPEVGRRGRRVLESESDLHDAMKKAFRDVDDIDTAAQLEPGAGRLLVLPKHLADEIMSDTKPSGAFGRGLDIAKGKQARIMLGLSPAWLQFQVAANAIQTALATKSLPGEWVYANVKWWRSLNEGEKKALEPYVGIGAFHDSVETPRMGAAANGGLINAYRAMKAHPFWHAPRKPLRGAAVSQMNPLDTLFRLDNAQNNFFRRAVLYNRLKREAFDRMGKQYAVHQRIVDKTLGKTGSDPAKMIKSLINDRAALEKGAESVRDFLGDYSTYTTKERRWLSRNVMFYGYLRFSLRFTFYTMPVKHPVMTAIIGQLGGLNAREVRELLGGDELPWALGKLYFTKGGKLKEIDLSRANPFMNAVTQAKIPEKGAVRGMLQSAVGFLPPMIGSAANIAFAKSLYKDRPYKVNGESSARPNKDGEAITDADALQIFGRDMLSLVSLYRMEEKARADGRPVSDDSIIGVNEKYTEYKDPKLRAGVQQARADSTPNERRVQSLLPLIPRTSRDPETAAKIRRATGKKSAPSAAGGTAVDAETQRLIDHYSAAPAQQTQDLDELQKLIDTYGR